MDRWGEVPKTSDQPSQYLEEELESVVRTGRVSEGLHDGWIESEGEGDIDMEWGVVGEESMRPSWGRMMLGRVVRYEC